MPDTPAGAFIHLIQDTVSAMRLRRDHNADPVGDLERFLRERLMPIWRREEQAGTTPYVLSLVGLTNVGKSTLMEALLKFPVAPRKMGPATAIPVEYVYNENWQMSVLFRDFRTDVTHFNDAKSLGMELKKNVVEVDTARATEIAWVTVSGPMGMLKDGLVMADTPGFGAAQIGDDDGSHKKRLEEFIFERVHRVYFCVAAGDTWAVQECERDFYKNISHLCGHVVVNKWRGSEQETIEYERRYRPVFPSAEFIFVNAKKAIQGQSENSPESIRKSNLDRLHAVIDTYSTPEKRRAMCDPELMAAWHDIHKYLEIRHRVTSIPWRRDSLNQFVETCRGRQRLAGVLNDLNCKYLRKGITLL